MVLFLSPHNEFFFVAFLLSLLLFSILLVFSWSGEVPEQNCSRKSQSFSGILENSFALIYTKILENIKNGIHFTSDLFFSKHLHNKNNNNWYSLQIKRHKLKYKKKSSGKAVVIISLIKLYTWDKRARSHNTRVKKKRQSLRYIAFRSRRCVFVVVVGGGILTEETIWASSKGKRCQASLIGLSGHEGHPQCYCLVLIP